jgi:DNA-binding transcriptional LysR family regulator
VRSSEAFVAMAEQGLAYCLIPELQIRQQLAGRHNARGRLIEEAMAERNARLARPIPDASIKGPLNHLRVNYGAEGHATPLLRKFITAAKGMPYALQSVAVDPLNRLGGKQIPGKLAGLLKGILRR